MALFGPLRDLLIRFNETGGDVMKLWQRIAAEEKRRVGVLPTEKRTMFALGCVKLAFQYLRRRFRGSIDPEILQLVTNSLKRFDQQITSGRVMYQIKETIGRLEAIVPEEDTPEDLVPGWSNFLNALIYAMASSEGDKSYAIDAAQYSYLAIFDTGVLAKLTAPLLEDEVLPLEEACKPCVAHIRQQLELLNEIERGETE